MIQAATATSESPNVRRELARLLALNRELIRRRIIAGDIELLATDVLGYDIEPFHRDMIEFRRPLKECLQLAPRGFGKSTILTVTWAIWEILCDRDAELLIASNTQGQAEVFLREISGHFQANERLRAIFGDYYDSKRWNQTEITVKGKSPLSKQSSITCVGIGGQVPGRHYKIIFADDLVDMENSWTDGQREKVKRWFYEVLHPAVLNADSRLWLTGTRYHPLDLYGHLSENEMAKRFQVVPAISAEGSTPWPRRFPLSWLEKKRDDLGSVIFNAQYQNDTSLMKGQIFKEEWFNEYTEEPDWPSMPHFVGCDPAATKRSATGAKSDWWTIVVGARRDNGDILIRDVWRARCSKDEYLNRLIDTYLVFDPVSVMIEDVAAQEYLAQDAEKHMPVRRVPRTKDKVARAYWLQAFFENGQVYFPAKRYVEPELWDQYWRPLREELLLFPGADHDDLFDGLQTMVEGIVGCYAESPVGFL